MGKQTKVDSQLKERELFQVKEPGQYTIILLNDDFTPMDFVVEVLITVFHKSPQEAYDLMMTVHRSGQAVIGRYTYDIAASKRARVMGLAKAAGYPFRVEIKED